MASSEEFKKQKPVTQLPPATPSWPIALRHESITQNKTTITIHNKPEPWHPLDYTVTHSSTETPLFTVHGHPWSLGHRRVFRDHTGLPLFELRSRWYNSSMLDLKLPGERGPRILSAKCRIATHAPKAVLRFRNASIPLEHEPQGLKGQDNKNTNNGDNNGGRVNDEDTVLEVLAQDLYNLVQVVMVGDRKVADIERITDPKELTEGQKPPFKFRPKWRVTVAEGVDLALIAVVAVIIGQQVPEVGTTEQ